jgi:hypothetical protein
MLVFAAPAQRSDKDDRNQAPTLGTGQTVGGPTGLFTVYDGAVLQKGEYTFSLGLVNYDRDPGNVDITSYPLSFNIGLSNRFELFFSTEAYRGVKVNNNRALSGFYLPNSTVVINGVNTTAPAIIQGPSGPGTGPYENLAVYRPPGTQPFTSFPYIGGSAGNFGLVPPLFSGPQFGFPAGTSALMGPPVAGGAAANFPGIGSTFGGLLPGIVLATVPIGLGGTAPGTFTVAPSYLPEMPFVNRTWGTSSFNYFDFGFKWRFNHSLDAIGYGILVNYRWWQDTGGSTAGFNQMQRGAGPGGNKGDINVTAFTDARLATWANLSGNIGYTYTSKATGNFGGTTFTMLDRPDEVHAAIGLDFPVNKYFQPIFEFRGIRYVGGRTPNALERHPIDGIAGVRIYPARWWGFGIAYRYNFNQQDANSFDGNSHTVTTTVVPVVGGPPGAGTVTRTFSGVPPGFNVSSDANGYIGQFWIGRRDKRAGALENKFPNIDGVDLADAVITLTCPPGTRSRSNQACNDSTTISVRTRASDPENDVLTYNYTVSGGRIVGTGANVTWDLTGVQPGSYTITTGVDDGCGVCGKTDTKTIRVEICSDCEAPILCSCPTVTISAPGLTSPGSPMTFTANAAGGSQDSLTYNWTVSAGTITSGQGTPSITVATTAEMAGSNVTATLELGGTAPLCRCQTSYSETAPVARREFRLVDEFGKATNDDIKARVDNFYIQLNADPTARGVIINYGTPAQIRVREAQIKAAINFRKYDPSRVTFIQGPDTGTGINTKFYIVPAGASDPTPN